MKGRQQTKIKGPIIPGNFFGFLNGTNFAPIANAMGGPKIKPRASIPTEKNKNSFIRRRYYGPKINVL